MKQLNTRFINMLVMLTLTLMTTTNLALETESLTARRFLLTQYAELRDLQTQLSHHRKIEAMGTTVGIVISMSAIGATIYKSLFKGFDSAPMDKVFFARTARTMAASVVIYIESTNVGKIEARIDDLLEKIDNTLGKME
jgi:hypothetical protein